MAVNSTWSELSRLANSLPRPEGGRRSAKSSPPVPESLVGTQALGAAWIYSASIIVRPPPGMDISDRKISQFELEIQKRMDKGCASVLVGVTSMTKIVASAVSSQSTRVRWYPVPVNCKGSGKRYGCCGVKVTPAIVAWT